MYHPDENNYFGDKLEVEIEKVYIKTSDNINLVGWFHNKSFCLLYTSPSPRD